MRDRYKPKDELTERRLEERIMYSPHRCPFCRQDDLVASDLDGLRNLNLLVTCGDCGRSWFEQYVLKGAHLDPDSQPKVDDGK